MWSRPSSSKSTGSRKPRNSSRRGGRGGAILGGGGLLRRGGGRGDGLWRRWPGAEVQGRLAGQLLHLRGDAAVVRTGGIYRWGYAGPGRRARDGDADGDQDALRLRPRAEQRLAGTQIVQVHV